MSDAMQMNFDIQSLVGLLLDLREQHDQLLFAVRGKQRCMRSGDMDGMSSWSAREAFLAEQIRSIDEERRSVASRMAEALGVEHPAVSLIAAKLDEPARSQLLALAGSIRELADQIYQVNRVNDEVTQQILQCFAQMQRDCVMAQCDIGLYDPRGQRCVTSRPSILDVAG